MLHYRKEVERLVLLHIIILVPVDVKRVNVMLLMSGNLVKFYTEIPF